MKEDKVISGFKFLTGDVNYREYGGKWYRKCNDDLYHVIDLINIWDATGEEDIPQYSVSLQEINLSTCDIKSALECSGLENEDSLPELTIVESISCYGSYAPMGNWQGNNYLKLLQSAKIESFNLTSSEYYHLRQLHRPVNRIGSSALEYSQGDFQSAIIRGIANDDPSAKLMGKIHGLNSEDISSIQGDDSLKDFSLTGLMEG